MARPAKPMFPPPTAEEICADGAFSPDGLAAFSSLSRDEVERSIASGELESFKHKRRVLIARKEAVRWLAAMLEAHREKFGLPTTEIR